MFLIPLFLKKVTNCILQNVQNFNSQFLKKSVSFLLNKTPMISKYFYWKHFLKNVDRHAPLKKKTFIGDHVRYINKELKRYQALLQQCNQKQNCKKVVFKFIKLFLMNTNLHVQNDINLVHDSKIITNACKLI